MAESSINLNHYMNIWIKMIFIELLLQRKLSLIRVYTQVIWFSGIFGAHSDIFPPFSFRQVWSLGFLWSSLRHFWSVFLFNFLQWNSNPLSDLLNTGFTIIEIGLFVVAKTCKWKYADSRLFWITWPCFSRPTTCENTSNTGWVLLIFIKTLKLLSKGLLINSNTR